MVRGLALSLLSTLPSCQWACAYGSVAIPQQLKTPSTSSSLIDLIIAVPDAHAFHKANLARNPLHYHWLPRVLGPKAIAALNGLPAGLYYNTRVEHGGRLFKYGVVETGRLVEDLEGWTTFYLAGRLQKPVEVVLDDKRVAAAMEANRRAALAASAIAHGPLVDRPRIFEAVASLSYAGDIRWAIGAENPEKVRSIVHGALPRFEEVYGPLLGTSPTAGRELEALPEPLKGLLAARERGEWPRLVREWISSKNRKFSSLQSLKGLLTAGPSTSLAYTAAKLKKGLLLAASAKR